VSEPEQRPLVPRDELEAAVAARHELEPEHEQALVESFLDRIGGAIDARIDERMAQTKGTRKTPKGGSGIAVESIVLGIPITAIAGGEAGIAGIVAVWAGIALVNFANVLRRR
jgi:hypothetical protein